VIAELSFSFWRYLIASHYDGILWRECLFQAFPGQKTRTKIYEHLVKLHNLRNRIAHHEPIHNMPLQQRYDELLTVIEWIDPDLRTWVEKKSTAATILAGKPDARR
jgi:hypothetical protein